MLKTLKTIKAQSKESYKVPRNVQDTLPLQAVWEDGICQIGSKQYSLTYSFSDINYKIAGDSQKEEMFLLYEELLQSLGAGAVFKITTNNRSINMYQWQEKTLLKAKGDDLDHFVEEYNEMLRQKIREADGIQNEHYITVTTFQNTVEEARTYFNRTWPALQSSFARLGSKLQQLDACERMRIYHDFFRPGEEECFQFNFRETMRRGHDFKDCFCPKSMEVHGDYLKLGDKYARVLFCAEYSSHVSDELISNLANLPRTMMVSVDVITIPTDETAAFLEMKRDGIESTIGKWQSRQNNNNNFSASIPYQVRLQREDMESMMDDVNKNDQNLNSVTLTIIHVADSLKQLNSDSKHLMTIRGCKLFTATYQQLDGLVTALPFGHSKISAKRTLLTRCLAATSMPFQVQEIQESGGIWYGVNTLTRNLILCDRRNLKNQGAFILGVPGSGKSMIAKEQIIFLFLSTNDTILINDPEGEYSEIVRKLGGTVVKIQAGGHHYLNAMAIENGYGEKDGIADKSEYIQTLFSQMSNKPISAQSHSIIDRCIINLYSHAAGNTVTLMDLHELLQQQPEEEGQELALTLERYTAGSLDMFAHETNVDMSNRLISFDISALSQKSDSLQSIAQLTITDIIINQVNLNSQRGLRTHIFTDEIQKFFSNEHSADFFDSAWRQWRKRNGYPTAITQNVSVLLSNPKSRAMLSNSETVVLLNQSESDQKDLGEIFNIPDEQLSYVKNVDSGSGLLLYGGKTVPFTNRFPKGTSLYNIMTTDPNDGFRGGE